LQGNQP